MQRLGRELVSVSFLTKYIKNEIGWKQRQRRTIFTEHCPSSGEGVGRIFLH